jgi:hypothetical protein
MQLTIHDRDDLHRYHHAARIAATKHDRPGETLTQAERATALLNVLREAGAL